MIQTIKYCCFVLLIIVAFTAQGQYLCDNEYKVINKQKKLIKENAKKIATDWVLKNKDSLKLPEKLKLSKLKFHANEKEISKSKRYSKWFKIDSLLCIETDPKLITKAKKRLVELNLVVYNISSSFNFDNTKNSAIKSELLFEFNFKGELIRAVIRKKKMSPFTETHYH